MSKKLFLFCLIAVSITITPSNSLTTKKSLSTQLHLFKLREDVEEKMEWLIAAGETGMMFFVPVVGPILVFSTNQPPIFVKKTIFLSAELKPKFGAIPLNICYFLYCLTNNEPNLIDRHDKTFFDYVLERRDSKRAALIITSWGKYPKISELSSNTWDGRNALHKFFTHATEKTLSDKLFFIGVLKRLLDLNNPELIIDALTKKSVHLKTPLDIAYEKKLCPLTLLILIDYLHEHYKKSTIYSTPSDHFFRAIEKGFFEVANGILYRHPSRPMHKKFKKEIEARYGSYANFKATVPLKEDHTLILDKIFEKNDVVDPNKSFSENLKKLKIS